MSWWNSSNLTSFASQALKTAQKRIDKVLDIGGEDGSPPSSLSSEEKEESLNSPESEKETSDGDNFWSAWLGDGVSEGTEKEEQSEEEADTESLSKLFTSGFKSERAKSKVEEAIMSTSTTKNQKYDNEANDETTGNENAALTKTEDSASSTDQATDLPDQSVKSEDKIDASDVQVESSGPTKLAITDMVSNVSDGWSVEGWAADGQLEDLLQTSMIQKMEDEGDKMSDAETGMTRSLSSSSAVTVQDLEPSLVVAEPEETESEDIEGEKPVTDGPEECVTVETEESPSSDSGVQEYVEEETDDSSPTDLLSTDTGSPVEETSDDKNVVVDATTEHTETPLDVHEGAERPTEINDSNAEAVIEKYETPTDPEEHSVESGSVEASLLSEETVNDQPGSGEYDASAEDAEDEDAEDIESESGSKDLSMDQREFAETEASSDAEVGVGADQGISIDAGESELKTIPSGSELDSEEKEVGSDYQEKKASEWVVEMCQLKDSITSTTASDELSDSNRTITSEDAGELSIDVGETSASVSNVKTEAEGGHNLQQDQMTLKVAPNSEMVSSTVSSSSLVKNLEDAMVESLKDNDSHSTASTEKSSEMVRIESGHNSGHTSGDDIETTTSSDIEIISTPNSNGEYKLERPFEFSPLRYALSRTVRHSPPGHKRSDSSSSGHSNWSKSGDDMLSPEGGIHTLEEDDTSGDPMESEKLIKKLADMAEVLEARESKLMELSRESIDLQEANNILRQQLQQSEEAREVEMSDLTTLTEEFTKRLSEAEKKYTTLARERDGLKRQLKDAETILAKRSDNSAAVEKLLKEKDQQISELLAEGEKLSKQQLQSNNIIKKLRNKEKENETLIKSQNQKIESEGAELEHLRKVLDVKEDLEKKQIEAINQLNNHVKKQDVEINKLKSEAEDYQEKIRSMQVTLDNSYKEIAGLHKKSATKASEAQEASAELAAKEELRKSLERHKLQARHQNEALISQIEDLRLSLTRMEKEHARKEDILRQEISDLQQRLQEGENRNQELTEGVSAATRPLLRQIENIQSTYAAQSSSFEKVERTLTERLADAQAQLANAQEKERNASEKFLDISTRIKGLESQVAILRQEKSTLSAQLEMERAKVETLEDTRNSDITQLEATRSSLERELSEAKKQRVLLENQLEMEKMKVESEKKKVQFAQDTVKEKELELQLQQSLRVSPEVSLMTRSSHASLSRESSIHENMSHSLVMADDGMEKSFMMVSPSGNKTSLYETLRQTGASTLIENLQSQLKMREGEISQLQSDITELEKTRESMARELVNVSNEKETIETQVEEFGDLKTKFNELDNRYNALLMMYGEKVEEAEELKLDLQDVKDMYKAQIEELVNKR